jgi:choline dehydrogenase-like flavoprotein
MTSHDDFVIVGGVSAGSALANPLSGGSGHPGAVPEAAHPDSSWGDLPARLQQWARRLRLGYAGGRDLRGSRITTGSFRPLELRW